MSGQPVRVLQTNPRKFAGIGTCLESTMSVAVKTGASNLSVSKIFRNGVKFLIFVYLFSSSNYPVTEKQLIVKSTQ